MKTNNLHEEQACFRRIKFTLIVITKLFAITGCLYFFICSLVLMTESLNLLAGRTAVNVLKSDAFLKSPVVGLAIGMMVTVVVQSSSTSISIAITVVAAGVISVSEAIPLIMGANIGTSVTNTAVSFSMASVSGKFELAFAGATVHDCFNFLTVALLLPLELISDYLETLSKALITNCIQDVNKTTTPKFLKILTEPIVNKIIRLNSTLQMKMAKNESIEENNSLIWVWCEQKKVASFISKSSNSSEYHLATRSNSSFVTMVETTSFINVKNITTFPHLVSNSAESQVVYVGVRKCDQSDFLFANTHLSDSLTGGIIVGFSLIILISCLLCMVKIMASSLQGSSKETLRKVVNTKLPSPFSWLSSYVTVLVGCGLTMIIQSSSVVTSTLTPLVGLGIVSLTRMYAVTVGANIGTTVTAILAALATGNLKALQLAFCHFLFNLTGFLLWFPVLKMRKIPCACASYLGSKSVKYRWFAILYLILVFFLCPLIIFGLSFAPHWLQVLVLSGFVAFICLNVSFNFIQKNYPNKLPVKIRNRNFLPLWLRSLKPFDNSVSRISVHLCQGQDQHNQRINSISKEVYVNKAYEDV